MPGPKGCTLTLLVSVLMSTWAFSQPAGPPLPPGRDRPGVPKRPEPSLTRVASEVSEDGIEVAIIAPSEPRYPEGAPVLITVAPALRAGKLDAADRLGASVFGVVVINFAYPPDAFDVGGPLCRRALADVILFAMGKQPDIAGRHIDRLCPTKPAPGLVGVIGNSHGGNSTVTTLQEHAEALADVAFYVSYESPCGTSPESLGDTILVDYGVVRDDPDPSQDADGNGFPWDDAANPHRLETGKLDFSKLAWDPEGGQALAGDAGRTGLLFLDGNGNGTYDTAPLQGAARDPLDRQPAPVTADIDGNGHLDGDEDFALGSLTADVGKGPRRYYSLSVATAAEQARLGDELPEGVARAEETREFWMGRDMAGGFDRPWAAPANMPAIIVSGRVDHVQAACDYPHIRAQYEGLRAGGLKWVKINPDPVYVHAFLGPTEADFPDNAPNCDVTAEAMWRLSAPTQRSITMLLAMASVLELADRVHAGNLEPKLQQPLAPVNLPRRLQPPPDQFATQTLLTR